jgi:hypothetical protein
VPCLCNGCYYRNEVCLQLRHSNACRSCYSTGTRFAYSWGIAMPADPATTGMRLAYSWGIPILLLVWQHQTECRSEVHHSSSRACSSVGKMPMGELILHKFHHCPKQIRISMELQRNPYDNNLKVTPQIYMLRACNGCKRKKVLTERPKTCSKVACKRRRRRISLSFSLSPPAP